MESYGKKIAVLLPCYNEEAAIAKVVQDFRAALPGADIYVYDNNSNDNTIKAAGKAGAIVKNEQRQGKGNVVRRMFADIDADIYVMADGDDTYHAASAPGLVEKLIEQNLDMVVAVRDGDAYRKGHKLGNMVFNKILALFFNSRFSDIFSGYRVFSRRFVKSFPAMSSGFDIETELSVHSLQLNIPVAEVKTPFKERLQGSHSKLSTFKDGFKILWRIFILFKEIRPLAFFGSVFFLLAVLSVIIAYPVVITYAQTGLVPRLPTAILAMGVMLTSFLSLTIGIILDSVSNGRKEIKRLHYLS